MMLSNEEMRDEAGFWVSLRVAEKMLEEGIISDDEYKFIVGRLRKEFPAVIGGLLLGENEGGKDEKEKGRIGFEEV